MKKYMVMLLAVCLLLAGCSNMSEQAEEASVNTPVAEPETAIEEVAASEPEQQPAAEAAVTVQPLPDTTMENTADAILAVSLEEGDAYIDDEGKMQMKLEIYTYDKYDLVDISNLKVGDTLVTHYGEVEITSVERDDSGVVCINGGYIEDGIDLYSEETGVFYEVGANDMKEWYVAGEATFPVHEEFEFHDSAELIEEATVYYAGSFLTDEVTDYYFNPYNTTVRIEDGQLVFMERVYTP